MSNTDTSDVNVTTNQSIIQPGDAFLKQFQEKQEEYYKSLLADIEGNKTTKQIQFQNIDEQKLVVKKSSENRLNNWEIYIGILQIIIILIIVVSIIIQKLYLVFISVFIHCFLALVKSFSSTALYLLNFLLTPQQFKDHIQKMKQQNPLIYYFVSAYHEKIIENQDYSRNVKCVHFTKTYKYQYEKSKDITPDINNLFNKQIKIIKFKINLKWLCSSPQTQINWELLKKQAEAEASNYDDIIQSWEFSELDGLQHDILASNQQLPFYYNKLVLIIFSLLGMGLFYDFLFYNKLGFCDLNIKKSLLSQNSFSKEQILTLKLNKQEESLKIWGQKNPLQISNFINKNTNSKIICNQSQQQFSKFVPIQNLYRINNADGIKQYKHTQIYNKMLKKQQQTQYQQQI